MAAQKVTTLHDFCDKDADIVFTSRDNVVFRIHSKHIECCAGSLLPMNASLPEDSAILRLLFSFIYPEEHPSLEDVNFETLLDLGEAAEKYQVFGAMNVCKIRIRHVVTPRRWWKANIVLMIRQRVEGTLDFNAPQLLRYGYRHGYYDLLNVGAKHLQELNLDATLRGLPSELILPWVKYWEKRRQKIMQALVEMSFKSHATDAIPPVVHASAPKNAPAVFTFGVRPGARPAENNVDALGEILRQFHKVIPSMTSQWVLESIVRKVLSGRGVEGDISRKRLVYISLCNCSRSRSFVD